MTAEGQVWIGFDPAIIPPSSNQTLMTKIRVLHACHLRPEPTASQAAPIRRSFVLSENELWFDQKWQLPVVKCLPSDFASHSLTLPAPIRLILRKQLSCV